ncbi:capsid maturation protease [Sesbania bispinosa]|nr:capsid maturation protease [Sesbania bispinosa]
MEVAHSGHTPEDLHGDWLVVSRVKRNRNKSQVKGVSVSGSQNKDGLAPKNLVTTVDSHNTQGSQNSGQIVFHSKPLPQPNSPNARKKRHRTEPPPKAMTSLGSQSLVSPSKANSVEAAGTSHHPYGIKTMMNVEVVSGNRLRFRDEDDPRGSPNFKSVSYDQAVDSKDQGMTNQSDAEMEASIAQDQ